VPDDLHDPPPPIKCHAVEGPVSLLELYGRMRGLAGGLPRRSLGISDGKLFSVSLIEASLACPIAEIDKLEALCVTPEPLGSAHVWGATRLLDGRS
jgi:hypothetical protein